MQRLEGFVKGKAAGAKDKAGDLKDAAGEIKEKSGEAIQGAAQWTQDRVDGWAENLIEHADERRKSLSGNLFGKALGYVDSGLTRLEAGAVQGLASLFTTGFYKIGADLVGEDPYDELQRQPSRYADDPIRTAGELLGPFLPFGLAAHSGPVEKTPNVAARPRANAGPKPTASRLAEHFAPVFEALPSETMEALKAYQSDSSESFLINMKLRYPDQSRALPALLQDRLGSRISTLDRAFVERLPEDVTLYRGELRVGLDLKTACQLASGGYTEADPGFRSASVRQSIGEIYAKRPDSVLFEMRVPRGTPAIYLDALPQNLNQVEQEVLLPRNTRWRYTGAYQRGDGLLVVQVDLIP